VAMPTPQEFRRGATPFFAIAMLLIGIALIVRMALLGNPIGIVLGVLFTLAGAGRLYVARKTG
jgi:ABC-type amino acid transport system permease subunit